MRRALRGLSRDRRGVAALEFAMLGGVLIAMCVGTIEVGLLFWCQNSLEAAAAETARCVAVGSSQCTDAGTYAAGIVAEWMFSGVITASDVTEASGAGSCNGSSATLANYVTVTVTSSYFADRLPSFVPQFAHRTLSATACYPEPKT